MAGQTSEHAAQIRLTGSSNGTMIRLVALTFLVTTTGGMVTAQGLPTVLCNEGAPSPIDSRRMQSFATNKASPVDSSKDKAQQPPDKEALEQALADLKSNDAATRKRAADTLAQMRPIAEKKIAVIQALQERFLDKDLTTRKAVHRALDVWIGKSQPGTPLDPKNPPAIPRDPPPHTNEVEWKVKIDPAEKVAPGQLNLSGSVSLQFMAPTLYPSLQGCTQLATCPTAKRDSIQALDMRQLKFVGKPIVATFDAFNYGVAALSPDGAHVAAANARATRPTVEVWSTATGQIVHKLDLELPAGMVVQALDFASKDRLLTACQKGKTPNPDDPTTYHVWDLKTGKQVGKFEYNLCMHPKWAAFSPGGNYLVLQVTANGYRLVFFDLRTARIAGVFEMQDKKDTWGQAAGVTFSPDGTQVALIWRLKKKDVWGRLLCFDLKTQKKIHDHALGYDPETIEGLGWVAGGLSCLQWIPDGSGWLLFSHLLLEKETGAVVWHFGKPEPWKLAPPRRFLDREHMTVVGGAEFSPTLSIEKIPWDRIDPEIKKARSKKN